MFRGPQIEKKWLREPHFFVENNKKVNFYLTGVLGFVNAVKPELTTTCPQRSLF
jgi:hypothetical protein